MSFLRRLLSSDYRKAIAFEAAGDYELAARYFALAGHKDKVAEMHLLRAERATSRGEELAALRDAHRWGPEDTAARRTAAARLARALISKARGEGVASERDREVVREAAGLLEEAGEPREAGEAWELAGDDEAAARAYEKGGVLDKMELALARDEQRSRTARRLRAAFEDYELFERGGDREAARAALQLCCELAGDKGEYKRLLGELDRRRLAGGRVTLRRRPAGPVAILCGGERVTAGRQPSCELTLRAAGVSRVHAEVTARAGGFHLRDAGSRHGTRVAGLPVEGEVPLEGQGRFGLGDDCEIAWTVVPATGGPSLRLEVARGLDKGAVIVFAAPGVALPLTALDVAAQVVFRAGVPYLETRAPLRLDGHTIARGVVQLVRDDVIALGDVELEVQ